MLNSTAWGRYGRGMTASWVAVLTAAFSHTAAGAPPPHPLLILLVLLISGPIGVLLAGRRRSLGSLAVVVTGAQLLFHGLFTLFPLHLGELRTTTAAGGGAGHAHHSAGLHEGGLLGGGPHSAELHSAGLHSAAPHAHADHLGSVMLLAHLLAAAVTLWGLRYGEVTLLRLIDLLGLRAVLRVLTTAPLPAPRRPAVPATSAPTPLIGRILRPVLRLRGPPPATA